MVNKRNPSVSDLEVDEGGLRLRANGDFPVDVHFGDKRIFSFWTERDTETAHGVHTFGWPGVLKRFLDGRLQLSLVDPVEGTVLAATEVSLGSGEGEVLVADRNGEPMGLDKSMRLMRLFVDQGDTQRDLLLDSMDSVIAALQDAGVKPFLAYGTLLGAVRQQDFIGHDSDADLGYVSSFENPVDVIRESFMLQRRIRRMGFAVFRYSGLGFKISVRGADGSSRGLDVFGGFMRDGQLYLMGEVGVPFRREWIDPLKKVTLAGREFPSPAVPEHLLEAMYGPHWKVPDPAYKFTTPHTTQRRLNGWFRGVRAGLDERWATHNQGRTQAMGTEVSEFARTVHAAAPGAATVVDLGSGRGVDAVWLAQQGHHVLGLDYFEPDLRRAALAAEEAGADAEFHWTNFGDLRSCLAAGAYAVRLPGPRTLMGHHVLDSMASRGYDNLFVLARMVARKDGVLHLQHYVKRSPRAKQRGLSPVRPRPWRAALTRSGGRILGRELITEHQAGIPGAEATAPPKIERVTVTWDV